MATPGHNEILRRNFHQIGGAAVVFSSIFLTPYDGLVPKVPFLCGLFVWCRTGRLGLGGIIDAVRLGPVLRGVSVRGKHSKFAVGALLF